MRKQQAPARLKVETWPISRLAVYARNPRKNDHAVDQMVRAIQEFGFRIPVVAHSNGELIDGHLRLKAAQKIGLAEVPVALADDLTPAQIKAFRLLANRSAAWAEWDDALLTLELGELGTLEFDLSLTGFSSRELDKYLDGTGGQDPDEAPELAKVAVSKPGDVWMMGEHRLICGDATDAGTVKCLLAGTKPHLMVTDPPYGVSYDAGWRGRAFNDGAERATGDVTNDHRADWLDAWMLFPGDAAYVWHGYRGASAVHASLDAASFDIRGQIVWAKSRLVVGRGDYHFQHETCWYAVRRGRKSHWQGARDQTTLWTIAHAVSETGHSTQKPVECMSRPMENNSRRGDAVYDPFMGSGTSIIAAEMLARRCYGIELDPLYVDLAVRRWQQFTGKQATRESDGRTFDDIAAEASERETVA